MNMDFEITRVRPGEDLTDILPLRKEIFQTAEDDLDDYGINILFKQNGDPVAVGRILLDPENDRIIIDQIGVREDKRHCGIGSEMLSYLTGIAKDSHSGEVWAKAKSKPEAVALLSKQGFEELDYFWMTKELYSSIS